MILIAVGGLLGGAGYVVVQSPQFKELTANLRKDPIGPEVRLETVKRGDLTRSINAPGTIEPRTVVQVGARVSARIVALPVEEGQVVHAGDVLVRLDAQDLVAQLESAQASLKSQEASLASAEARLEEAGFEVERSRELYQTRDIARSELDAAEARFKQAQAAVRSAHQSIAIAGANIARAQKDVDYTTITAPIDGVVTRRNFDVGEMVLGTFNNIGSVIVEIADLKTIIMRARVDEANVAEVREGQRAKVHLNAYADRTFDGVVDRVRLHREIWRDGTGYVEAEIALETVDGDRLYSGLTANADIQIETLHDVIKIPSQAVVDRRIDDLPDDVVKNSQFVNRNKTFARVVYRFIDGEAIATPVSVGSSDLTHTVILGGLSDGDRIVVGPYKQLVGMKHKQAIRDADAGEAEGEDPEGVVASGESEDDSGAATDAGG